MDFNYIIFLCLFGSFIPTIVLTVVYVLIYKEIIDQVRPHMTSNPTKIDFLVLVKATNYDDANKLG